MWDVSEASVLYHEHSVIFHAIQYPKVLTNTPKMLVTHAYEKCQQWAKLLGKANEDDAISQALWPALAHQVPRFADPKVMECSGTWHDIQDCFRIALLWPPIWRKKNHPRLGKNAELQGDLMVRFRAASAFAAEGQRGHGVWRLSGRFWINWFDQKSSQKSRLFKRDFGRYLL